MGSVVTVKDNLKYSGYFLFRFSCHQKVPNLTPSIKPQVGMINAMRTGNVVLDMMIAMCIPLVLKSLQKLWDRLWPVIYGFILNRGSRRKPFFSTFHRTIHYEQVPLQECAKSIDSTSLVTVSLPLVKDVRRACAVALFYCPRLDNVACKAARHISSVGRTLRTTARVYQRSLPPPPTFPPPLPARDRFLRHVAQHSHS